MDTQQAVDEFILSCNADGLSDATLRWYLSLLKAFVTAFPGRDIATITTHELRLYVVSVRGRDRRYIAASNKPEQPGGLSDTSVAAHVRALHRFWAWAALEFKIENPMSGIRRHKLPKPKPAALESADFVKLFNATGDNVSGVRNRAILAFLADTGCRLGGLASLKVGDLDIDRRRAVVNEKGGQRRTVHFTAVTARFLYQWLQHRAIEGDSVFGLQESGVYQVLKRLKQKAGVNSRVNPHAFRHNFARAYLQNGGDLVSLARLMGHSNIQTTVDYYAIFDETELNEMHDRFTPMKGLIDEI
jgi:integrase/recombinase XerD